MKRADTMARPITWSRREPRQRQRNVPRSLAIVLLVSILIWVGLIWGVWKLLT